MFLRRIISSYKRQDWTLVSIELAILVAGIYLGLQVDSWQEDREKARSVDVQLARILEDAKFFRDHLESTVNHSDEYLARAALTMRVLDGEALSADNADDFEFALQDSYRIDVVDPVLPSLEQMLSSGDIQLISDEQVYSALSKFVNYRRRQSEVLNHVAFHFDHLGQVVQTKTTWHIEETQPDNELGANYSFRYDIEELRQDETFRYAIGNLAIMTSYQRMRYQGYRDHINEIIDLLSHKQQSH